MNKSEIKKWCEGNGYVLVNIKRKDIDPDVIFNLAKESCFVNGDLMEKTRKQELTFARNLAIKYLSDSIPPVELSRIFKMNHATAIHARNIMQDEIQFFKGWQQRAIKHFDEKIKEIEKWTE